MITRHQQFNILYPDLSRIRRGQFDLSLVRATQARWETNNLHHATSSFIGREAATNQHILYNFGSSNWRGSASVLWLSDSSHPSDGFLTGYIDQFDPGTGLSIGQDFVFVHDRLHDQHGIDLGRVDTFCLLGTHLVHRYPQKPIVVVRHPITALVSSFHLPEFTWLAVGAYGFIDLNCPSYILGLPGSQPVVLLPEPDDLNEWTRNAHHFQILSKVKDREAFCLPATSLPSYFGDITSTIHNTHPQVKIAIENLLQQKWHKSTNATL